jgi:hypothetical protein
MRNSRVSNQNLVSGFSLVLTTVNNAARMQLTPIRASSLFLPLVFQEKETPPALSLFMGLYQP